MTRGGTTSPAVNSPWLYFILFCPSWRSPDFGSQGTYLISLLVTFICCPSQRTTPFFVPEQKIPNCPSSWKPLLFWNVKTIALLSHTIEHHPLCMYSDVL